MNRNESLFLTLKCRYCGSNYLFWRETTVQEVFEMMEKLGDCSARPLLNGKVADFAHGPCILKGWIGEEE